jgi:hypothetical protein
MLKKFTIHTSHLNKFKHCITRLKICHFSIFKDDPKKKPQMSEFNKFFLTSAENNQIQTLDTIPALSKLYLTLAEVDELDNILNLLNSVSTTFDLEKFRKILDYVQDNYIDEIYIFKMIESILARNLNAIDYITKSTCVFILSKNIFKKKIKLREDHWHQIYYDFLGIVEGLNFGSYYNYLVSFDKIRNRLYSQSALLNDIEHFIEERNTKLFNKGKIKLGTLDDLLLFSGLVHNKLLSIRNIHLNVWRDIDNIISNEKELNTNSLIIAISILINYFEQNSNIKVLEKSIRAINRHIDFLYSNFNFLEYSEQTPLVDFCDTIFYYYSFIYHSNIENLTTFTFNDDFLPNLIQNYMTKLEKKNFNFFQEIKILVLIGKELKYRDQKFWEVGSRCVLEWLENHFMKMLNEVSGKRIANNNKDEQNIMIDLSTFFYMGIIMDTFASVNFADQRFWNIFLNKLEEFTNISARDPMLVLNFIFLNGKKMLKANNMIYELFISRFEPNFRQILSDKELVDYLIKINFLNYDIDSDLFNKNISNLFAKNDYKETNNLMIYITLMKLLDKLYLKKNEKSLVIMCNILIDLVKHEPNTPNMSFQLKTFYDKIKDQTKFKKFIRERLVKLLTSNDLTVDEGKQFENIFYNLKIAGFLDKIEVARLSFMIKEYPKLLTLINRINDNI